MIKNTFYVDRVEFAYFVRCVVCKSSLQRYHIKPLSNHFRSIFAEVFRDYLGCVLYKQHCFRHSLTVLKIDVGIKFGNFVLIPFQVFVILAVTPEFRSMIHEPHQKTYIKNL